MGKTLSLNMIFGNSEERFINFALCSILPLVDEAVLVNTGDENNINLNKIEETIKQFKNKIKLLHFPFTNFAECRNYAIENSSCDWILRQDADEVYDYNSYNAILSLINDDKKFDIYWLYFYHFIIYPWYYQDIYPCKVLFKNNGKIRWNGSVHEQLNSVNVGNSDIKFYHYGYCQPQYIIMNKWKHYMALEGQPEFYKDRNPNTCISDRIKVCKYFDKEHPEVMRDYVSNIKNSYKIGLFMIVTPYDIENAKKALNTLFAHNYNNKLDVILILDGGVELKHDKIKDYIKNENIPNLPVDMNIGFNYFLLRNKYKYFGWIHPDMIFLDYDWLYQLEDYLDKNPNVGKVCSQNTRDGEGVDRPGSEQCYLVRREAVDMTLLFDERFECGYEDWDFNRRMMETGYDIMINSKSRVYHEAMQTRKNFVDGDNKLKKGSELYYEKWHTYEPPV